MALDDKKHWQQVLCLFDRQQDMAMSIEHQFLQSLFSICYLWPPCFVAFCVIAFVAVGHPRHQLPMANPHKSPSMFHLIQSP